MEENFSVTKQQVYTEVAQTTSYTGAKMDDDANAYERIFTTDEDQKQLDRFWDESCIAFCESMKKYLAGDRFIGDKESVGHEFVLELSQSFDPALLPSMRKELISFFVMNITSKWYVFTNKKEADAYALSASELLEGLRRKACHKKRPQRPTYN